MSANNDTNQQIGQVRNVLPQHFFIPAVTTSTQQPYQQIILQVKHHKANMSMDDYELSHDGSANDDPENTTNDWQCVQNSKKKEKEK